MEHVIRELKKFEIIGDINKGNYRRFEMRIRLISGVYGWGR